MKRILTVRLVIAAVMVLAAFAAFVATLPPVQAMFSPGVCVYYSTAKYKTAVGARGTGCCGEPISWGIVTAYRKCEPMYCLDVYCPDPTE